MRPLPLPQALQATGRLGGEPGALGAGTRVKQLKYRLATVDAGFKYRGFSGFLEYYWRFLNDFVGDGQFDRQSLFDQGGSAFLGYCLIPRTWEVYGRTSALTGQYGTAQEYGGGLNWYLNKTRQNRFTIEGLYINRSPALNFIYPYRAGFTGAAIQRIGIWSISAPRVWKIRLTLPF